MAMVIQGAAAGMMGRVAGRKRFGKAGFLFSSAYMVLIIVCALLAGLLAPHDPLQQDLTNTFAGPSGGHLLGTDDLGRDVLSRMIWGARPALVGVAVAMGMTAAIALPWGLVSGFAGGIVDLVLMRIADTLLVMPFYIVAIALTASLGPSTTTAMVSVGIAFSPGLARLLRSGVLVVKDRDYVVVTRMYGLGGGHRMLRHILPNAFAPIAIQLALLAGISLVVETALGFLGVGSQPPNPDWGSEIAASFRYVLVNPVATFVPVIVVLLAILAIYRIGDEVSDRLGIYN